jgi:hypothetical protein
VLLAATAALITVRLADSGPSSACREGARPGEIVAAPAGGQAVPTTALGFDELHATVWRADRQGRAYYWATAGPTAVRPFSGGARIRWRLDTGGTWHDCAASFPAGAGDDAPTPAVATVVAGHPVRLEACLWRDSPFREQCTAIAA